MTKVTKPKVPGDLVVHVESLEYCTKTAILRNGGVGTVVLDNFVGYPLKAGSSGADYVLAVAGDEANVIALLMDGPAGVTSVSIAATSNSALLFQALAHAPCIVNQDVIRKTDTAAAAFNVANIATALKLLGWEVRTEPTNTTQMAG